MKTSDHSGGPTGDGSYHEDDKEVSAEHSTHHTPHHEYKPTFIPTSYDKEEYVEWLDDRIGSKEGLESLQDPSLSESQIKRNPKNTKDNKESKKSFFEFMSKNY